MIYSLFPPPLLLSSFLSSVSSPTSASFSLFSNHNYRHAFWPHGLTHLCIILKVPNLKMKNVAPLFTKQLKGKYMGFSRKPDGFGTQRCVNWSSKIIMRTRKNNAWNSTSLNAWLLRSPQQWQWLCFSRSTIFVTERTVQKRKRTRTTHHTHQRLLLSPSVYSLVWQWTKH